MNQPHNPVARETHPGDNARKGERERRQASEQGPINPGQNAPLGRKDQRGSTKPQSAGNRILKARNPTDCKYQLMILKNP
jgi:hypothetical protein